LLKAFFMASSRPPSGEVTARIRVAAQEAIKHIPGAVLGDGEINEIIRQTGSDQLNMAERLTRASSLATDIAKAYNSKPISYANATPEQIDSQRAALGLPPLARGSHAFLRGRKDRDDAGERQATSASYSRALAAGASDPAFLRSLGLSDVTGKGLGALGFTSPEQVRQVVGDAKTLGLSPNAAAMDLGRLRKAEGARTEEHVGALKAYGDTLRSLNSEEALAKTIKNTKEREVRLQAIAEKRRKAEEDLKAHRDGRVQTQDGKKSFDRVRDRVRAQDRRRAELEGDKKVAFGESHERRIEDNRAGGSEKKIEGERLERTAGLAAKPAQSQSNLDELASLADKAPATVKSDASPARTPGPRRSAVNTKSLKPTV
jgi:hypothetical protein